MPAQPFSIGVDAHKFFQENAKIKAAVARAVEEAAKEGAQRLYNAMAANLRGPHIGKAPKTEAHREAIGKMPVPRRTGNLARSAYIRKVTSYCYIVGSDTRIAKYNKKVHDGVLGTNIKPRRFLGDAVRKNRLQIQNMMRKKISDAINQAQS